MSPNIENRNRYSRIQRKFKEIFDPENLSFDVVNKYGEDNPANQMKNKKEPQSVTICITDKKSRQFLLDAVDAGISQAIYLLTLSFGLAERVILLDEPALNLHPRLLKSLMHEIIGHNENMCDYRNQFIIITHSHELTHFLLFEEDAKIVHIKKIKDDQSKINLLDEKTEEWIKEQKTNLSYQIDTRLFFAKAVILTEGIADKFLLAASRHFASKHPELDLDKQEIMILDIGGKFNFSKYKKLADRFNIPCILIGDNGDQNEGENGKIFFIFVYHERRNRGW
jgi:predicted ATP-dependent endonuclease of OLD family